MRTLIVENNAAIENDVYVLYSNIVTSFKRDRSGRVLRVFTPVEIFPLIKPSNIEPENPGYQLIQLKSDFFYKFHDINSIIFWIQRFNETEPINLNLTLHFSFRKSC